MESQYVIPASIATALAVTLGITYPLSLVLPLEYKQLATWISWIIFIPAMIIKGIEYEGSSTDMFGAHDNAGLGVRYAGKTHRSVGDKNKSLLGDVEETFRFATIGFYGGIVSLLIIWILL